MIAVELGAERVDEALRAVRALGAHRYVAGRMHLVHAFAFASVGEEDSLRDGLSWAKATLSDGAIDPASRDERLWRRSTEAEVMGVLDAFWTPGARPARETLRDLLARHDLAQPDSLPFDEGAESDIHPLLIDAGWELVPLGALDTERHKGAIAAFGDEIEFASALFEEETAIPPPVHIYELPAIGPVELLRGVDDEGRLATPLVVWADGHPTYLDYVIRGVRRAAKLP